MPQTPIGVAEAEAVIADWDWRCDTETVALPDAAGRALAQEVVAERDQPPFDRVMMDGIAIRHGAWARGARRYTRRGTAAAGSRPPPLDDDTGCIEVMTGAPMPAGADCVIPVESLSWFDGIAVVAGDAEPRAGRYVHRRASDHPAGARLLAAGICLGGPETAVLAAAGLTRVRVARLPRAAIVTTGDELVPPDATPEDHQIRSANDHAIAAALRRRRLAACEHAHFTDEPDAMTRGMAALLERSDLLIVSGGVSRGRFDHVPAVLDGLGVGRRFHRVAQKPGRPMWFGLAGDKAVFALPGNPVATLTCLARYVIPALERAQGLRPAPPIRAGLAGEVVFEAPLTLFLPCTLAGDDDRLVATTRSPNTSGDFTSLAGTDGVVELPAGQRRFATGYPARFFSW